VNPDRQPLALDLQQVVWLPSSPESLEVRVFGTWQGATVPPAVELVVGAARVPALADAPAGGPPPAWSAAFLAPLQARAALEAGQAKLEAGGVAVALPAAVPGAMSPAAEDEPGGTVVDPGVLAERRARRAEQAEQSASARAASAEQTVETLRTQLGHLEDRLAGATAERDALAARVADAERRLRLAEQREEASAPDRRGRGGGAGAPRGGRRGRAAARRLPAPRRSPRRSSRSCTGRAARPRPSAPPRLTRPPDATRGALAEARSASPSSSAPAVAPKRRGRRAARAAGRAERDRIDVDNLRLRLRAAEAAASEVDDLRRRLAASEAAGRERGAPHRLADAEAALAEVGELRRGLAEAGAAGVPRMPRPRACTRRSRGGEELSRVRAEVEPQAGDATARADLESTRRAVGDCRRAWRTSAATARGRGRAGPAASEHPRRREALEARSASGRKRGAIRADASATASSSAPGEERLRRDRRRTAGAAPRRGGRNRRTPGGRPDVDPQTAARPVAGHRARRRADVDREDPQLRPEPTGAEDPFPSTGDEALDALIAGPARAGRVGPRAARSVDDAPSAGPELASAPPTRAPSRSRSTTRPASACGDRGRAACGGSRSLVRRPRATSSRASSVPPTACAPPPRRSCTASTATMRLTTRRRAGRTATMAPATHAGHRARRAGGRGRRRERGRWLRAGLERRSRRPPDAARDASARCCPRRRFVATG
jgi:hypothetical protein